MNQFKDICTQNLKEITQNYWNIGRGLQKQVLSLFPILLCLTFHKESIAFIGGFVQQAWQQQEPNQVKRAQKPGRSSTYQEKLETVRICGVTHNGFSEPSIELLNIFPKHHLVREISLLSLGGAVDFYQHLFLVLKGPEATLMI